MRFTLSQKERLILLEALSAQFDVEVRRRKDHRGHAIEIFNIAHRIGSGRTGRPEKTWSWYFESEPERYRKQIQEMIKNLRAPLVTCPHCQSTQSNQNANCDHCGQEMSRRSAK